MSECTIWQQLISWHGNRAAISFPSSTSSPSTTTFLLSFHCLFLVYERWKEKEKKNIFISCKVWFAFFYSFYSSLPQFGTFASNTLPYGSSCCAFIEKQKKIRKDETCFAEFQKNKWKSARSEQVLCKWILNKKKIIFALFLCNERKATTTEKSCVIRFRFAVK